MGLSEVRFRILSLIMSIFVPKDTLDCRGDEGIDWRHLDVGLEKYRVRTNV